MSELLVPIDVQALAIGRADEPAAWVDSKPEFRNIYRENRFLGQQMAEDQASGDSAGALVPGVHLHWALPDGLAQGTAAPDGSGMQFPRIPNRWLVVRFWDPDEAASVPAMQARAWIIESDKVTTEVRDEDTAAWWPTMTAARLSQLEDYTVRVGRRRELGEWPGETPGPRVELTAMGWGDPAFAASYPAGRGVLGFHDGELDDVPVKATLHYLVAGWYAELDDDPVATALRGADARKAFAQLDACMATRRWTYPGLADAQGQVARLEEVESELREAQTSRQRLAAQGQTAAAAEVGRRIEALAVEQAAGQDTLARVREGLPSRLLCHGVITGVRCGNHVDSGVPRGRPIRVAVGETMVEALATLLDRGRAGSDLGWLLALFQYDLLDEVEKPGGLDAVEARIHERRFRPSSRGRRWELQRESQPVFGKGPEQREPPIPGDVRRLLERLNGDQRRINRLVRQRDALKDRLYTTWYRRMLNLAARPGAQRQAREDALAQAQADAQAALARTVAELDALQDAATGRPRGEAWQRLQQVLPALLPGWTLQRLDEAPFWRPNDPVVLLAGEAFQRSERHGGDARYRNDGLLLCRLAGQEIAGIRVGLPHAAVPDAVFGSDAIDRWCDGPAGLRGRPVPAPCAALLREALLLTADDKRATAVVAAVQQMNGPGDATRRAAQARAWGQDMIESCLDRLWTPAGDPAVNDAVPRPPPAPLAGMPTWELLGYPPSPVMMSRWTGNPWLPLALRWQVRWTPAGASVGDAMQGWSLEGADYCWKPKSDTAVAAGPDCTYSGTTLLTAGVAQQLVDRLRPYNLARGNPDLSNLITLLGSTGLVSQSLGGFTDQLLMRKGYLELPPMEPDPDPEEGPQFSPLRPLLGDMDWLSPVVDGRLLPLRSGSLQLERLRVVDAFGRSLDVEDELPPPGLVPLVPARMAAGGGRARLAPRLAQAARIALEWLPAADAAPAVAGVAPAAAVAGPICGWVVPNLMDRGVTIYDARGRALGALQAYQRKAWSDGVGGKSETVESFHWVDMPGSGRNWFGKPPPRTPDRRLGDDADPQLAAYVQGLLSLGDGSGQAFSNLLARMGEVLGAAAPGGGSGNLGLLVGRPLALVRAVLTLELDGEPARAQGWDARADDNGGIATLRFPLRLGDWRRRGGRWRADDGLLGFFVGGDYTAFHPAWGLEGVDDGYSTYGHMPPVAVGQPLEVTLLLDPARGLCVGSGILPKVRFQLPGGDPGDVLDDQEVVFFTGPVLGRQDDGDIRMPQPSDVYGQWSWTHHPAVDVWRETAIGDLQKDWGRFSAAAPLIQDGWLKLVAAPLEVRALGVQGRAPAEAEAPAHAGTPARPARFRAAAGETVVLTWSVFGAEEVMLGIGALPAYCSNCQPLPVRYALQLAGPGIVTVTLTAVGRPARAGGAAAPVAARTIEIVVGAG